MRFAQHIDERKDWRERTHNLEGGHEKRFRPGDAKGFRSALKGQFPTAYWNYSLGKVKSRNIDIENLEVPALTFEGKPVHSSHRTDAPHNPALVVKPLDGHEFSKGLEGRTIAVWQSHGRAFSSGAGLWEWQRPGLFQTV